ncbi:hypothetical protein K8R20_01500 [bacterium]|nr:hypothetical protein [bacterium]
MTKKKVLILFGGISPEHEVSIITGLQVVENIDRSKYEVKVVEISKTGELFSLKGLETRKDYFKVKREKGTFGRDSTGGYISSGLKKYYPEVAYLAFHGGGGEGGAVQGMLETFGIAITSPSSEGATLSMNKVLAKQLVQEMGVLVVEGVGVMSKEVISNSSKTVNTILRHLSLPLIIKPAHLGSSIGISVVKDKVSFEKALIAASRVDTEILIESFLESYEEFNCSVIRIGDKIVVSEIERPITKAEILSFADKYERDGGKTTGSSEGGMASLTRELPAKIDTRLAKKVTNSARKIYNALRCDGLVRIDFMYSDKQLYFTELNQIPGSMAFYIWEASGLSFKEQISRSLEEAIKTKTLKDSKVLDYESDILEKFVS